MHKYNYRHSAISLNKLLLYTIFYLNIMIFCMFVGAMVFRGIEKEKTQNRLNFFFNK